MKIQIVLAVLGFALALAAPVEDQILKNLQEYGTTNVLVTFKKAEVEKLGMLFDSLKLNSRAARLTTLHSIYKDHADHIQADVIEKLKVTKEYKKHYYSQLWISGELVVRDVDKETVDMLRNHPDVKSLVAELFYPLEEVEVGPEYEGDGMKNQWGVNTVHAEAVWNVGNTGQGVVAAVIDTGARHTHVALSGSYRGTAQGSHNYNWFAPTGRADVPSDTNGHGTHVTGTIAGTANGIGVAPGSQWISCRGCAGAGCSTFDLLECGNWVACPTNTAGTSPDCSKAPNISNNSWGGGRGNSFYDAVIAAWTRGDILPIFASGNSGPNCNTVSSPSDRPNAISIGSTSSNNQISTFSSAGPTIDGRLKPEFSAPGTSVVSASHLNDTGYRTLSGTSMAAPHASGVAALLLRDRPNFTVAQARTALMNGSVAIAASGRTCMGIPDSTRPNHHVGAGRVDAVLTINNAIKTLRNLNNN